MSKIKLSFVEAVNYYRARLYNVFIADIQWWGYPNAVWSKQKPVGENTMFQTVF